MRILSFDIGIKNLAFCDLDENYTIYNWGLVNVMEGLDKKEEKKLSIEQIAKLIWDKLEQINDLDKISHVVLENQPSLKNPRMKTVQIIILGFFLSKKREHTYTYSIDCFLPRNKLDVYNGVRKEEIEASIKCKSVYSRTKRLSVEFCKDMLSNSVHNIEQQIEWLNMLNSSKKKDDLADSFMQGACYYKKKLKK